MLAATVKRKLLLFHYDGKDFVELKEVALPEAPLCAAWSGNYVCLGCRGSCVPVPVPPSTQRLTCRRACTGVPSFVSHLFAAFRLSCPELMLHHAHCPWMASIVRPRLLFVASQGDTCAACCSATACML